MIRSISLRNFKSYRDATLPLAPLSLLIGANASGKSNAIEGIRFLSWLAEGRRLDDLTNAVQAEDQFVRGTIRNLAYEGTDTFGFRCAADITYGENFSIDIQVTPEGMSIAAEEVTHSASSVPLYSLVERDRGFFYQVQVQYDTFAKGGGKPKIPCTDQQAIFTQLETPARFGAGHVKAQREIPRVVGQYRRFLQQILFLDPNPRVMRQYSNYVVGKSLQGDGSNLSSVLYGLCREKDRKEKILSFIKSLPEQDIRDLSFIETSRDDVMVKLKEAFGGRELWWDAPVLSDGTLRVLAVAAALLSAPEGSFVIIEEIDNGVHPSRAGMLLENIQSVAQARRVRVLVTTHNPALLDALPIQAIPDVVCCYRDPDEGDSRLARLEDLRDYPALVAQGPVGQLMAQGILDRFLKDRRSSEEKQAQALKWLETL